MLNYIEKLHKEPEEHKRKVLYVTVVFLMVIIVAVWLSTINIRIVSDDVSSKTDDGTNPISILLDVGKGVFENIKTIF